MSFTQIPSLVTFAPLTTILSADVNSNYAAIRNAFNGLVTGSNTIAVDTITENTLSAGVTVNKKFTISSGGLTLSATGALITVSGVNGGLSLATGGSVSCGQVQCSGTITVSEIAILSSGIQVGTTIAEIFKLSPATGNAVASGFATFTSGIATASATLSTAATAGFIYVGVMSATASGTPTVPTGTVPMVYETGNNHLMVYAGGAWRSVALT